MNPMFRRKKKSISISNTDIEEILLESFKINRKYLGENVRNIHIQENENKKLKEKADVLENEINQYKDQNQLLSEKYENILKHEIEMDLKDSKRSVHELGKSLEIESREKQKIERSYNEFEEKLEKLKKEFEDNIENNKNMENSMFYLKREVTGLKKQNENLKENIENLYEGMELNMREINRQDDKISNLQKINTDLSGTKDMLLS